MYRADAWTIPGGGSGEQTRVSLVGDMRVQHGTTVLGSRQLGGAKPRLVLVSLVLAGGLPVSKERLVAHLWGDRPPEGAVAALESHVSVLRSRLAALGCARLVRTVPHGYAVDVGLVVVDVWQAEAALAGPLPPRGARPTVELRRSLRRTLDRVDGPLLPDEADLPWLEEARARHSRRLSELRGLAARYELDAGDAAEGLRLAGRGLEQDPLDESAWCTVLECHVRLGQPVEAVRAFARCREVLDGQLGCAPGPRLQELLRLALRETADDGLSELFVALLHLEQATTTRPDDERRRIYARARLALADAVSA